MFVIIWWQPRRTGAVAFFCVDDNENAAIFKSRKEAEEFARQAPISKQYGYHVLDLKTGETEER